MSEDRDAIVARRARFIAAALAAYGMGCSGSNAQPVERPSATEASSSPPRRPTSVAREDADPDRDGVIGAQDHCPDVPEDRDGIDDDDGCPEDDADHDAIADDVDGCPKEPGNPSRTGPKAHGCPCLSIVQRSEIVIQDKIRFSSGSATLDSASLALLDGLAGALAGSANLKVLVTGHCDGKERPAIAEARAKAVLSYLVSKGVDASRLRAEGFGNRMPVADDRTAEGRARNRRVGFAMSE